MPGSAEALPFPADSFEAVACQFGLMYFPDRVAALREMGRVLAPGGRAGIAVWDRVKHSPVYPVLVERLERLADPEAAEALRAPFALGDADELGALFVEAAGFESVALETRSVPARYPSVRALVEAELRGWLPTMGVRLRESQVRAILVEAERALANQVVADGALEFETRAHLVTAVRRS